MVDVDARSFSDERARLLHQLDVERNQLVRNIETVRIRDIERPFVGEWSLKDIVGHINSWESEVVSGFHDLKKEEPPELLHFNRERIHEWNQDHVENKRTISFWSIYEQFQAGRERLLQAIAEVSDDDIGTEGSIHNRLVHSVIDHERDHWHQIAARLAGMPGVREPSVSVPEDAASVGEGV